VSSFEAEGEALHAITPDVVDAVLQRALAKAPFPGAGADESVFGRQGSSDEYVRVDLHVGTSPGEPFIDQYNVDFGPGGRCITAGDFKETLRIIKPFEAFVAEVNNEVVLDSYTRQQQIGLFKAPAIIRSLHYFDERLASQVGGIAHCLRAPAHHVERFLDGVFIDLVGDVVNPNDPAHLNTQRRVMEYLGMRVSPTADLANKR
jgi:hypothetical protein